MDVYEQMKLQLYNEKDFFAEYHRTRDETLREYILWKNRRLAYKISREFSTDALLTLWNCIKHWEPTSGLTFGTYAGLCIKRAIWKVRKKTRYEPLGIDAAMDVIEKQAEEYEINYTPLNGAELVIVMRRYFLDETFQEIADSVNMSKSAVMIVHAKALRKLHAAHLKIQQAG